MSLKKIAIDGILSNCKSAFDNCLPGTMIASPSTVDPDYYYHWTRDAALTSLLLIRLLSKLPQYGKEIYDTIVSYVFHEIATVQKNSLEYYAEPKYYVSGLRYEKDWGRPQNDGPAIRGYSLCEFAFYQLKNENTHFITQHLVDFKSKNGIIYQDFLFVLNHYEDVSFDLWEEIKGHHYFTSEFHYQFIKKFSQLADIYSEIDIVSKCRKLMVKIRKHLDMFYSKNSSKWIATVIPTNVPEHHRQWEDFGNILVYNYTQLFWNPYLHSHIGPTINKIASENIQKFGKKHGVILCGRYIEDLYYEGPPWILLTIGFAQWLKRVKKMLDLDGSIRKEKWFQELHEIIKDVVIHDDESFDDDNNFSVLVSKYKRNLEKLLMSIHQKNGGFHESFDQETLEGLSAKKLTWSYASYLHFYIE